MSRTLAIANRPHAPRVGGPAALHYKEWWHFNLIDDHSGLDVIVNLSVAGDIRSPDKGDANLVFLAKRLGQPWQGGFDQFTGLAARLDPVLLDVALGPSRIAMEGEALHLVVARTDGSLAADLRMTPLTEPLVVWKNTPLGRGHINWLIVPWLRADGEVRIADERIRVDGGRAYHDHNWGRWRWGDDFGWAWGFGSEIDTDAGEPISLVYDRTVDRQGSRTLEHSLMLWRGPKLTNFFARQKLRLVYHGIFREPVRRIPGVAALSAPGAVGTIPARLDITAEDNRHRIEASYVPDSAIQLALPRETGFGFVAINETMGWLTVRGMLHGKPLAATRRACFEFVA